jgi:hypothetical protein
MRWTAAGFAMAHTVKPKFWRRLTLLQMQGVKRWHIAQQREHTLEYKVWEMVLTAWLMGWIGWLPAYVFDASWAYPLCMGGMLLPQGYVYIRGQAHAAGVLRCDWLGLLG